MTSKDKHNNNTVLFNHLSMSFTALPIIDDFILLDFAIR